MRLTSRGGMVWRVLVAGAAMVIMPVFTPSAAAADTAKIAAAPSVTVPGPAVDTATEAVLKDGATINIAVRVTFKTTVQPEAVVKSVVSDWFLTSGQALGLTLSKFVNDGQYAASLLQSLRAIRDADSAAVAGFSIVTPPIAGFAEKAKSVVAILKSGENVRLTFGPPEGSIPAAGPGDLGKAYELLASLNYNQLGAIQTLLNQKLLPPGNGWSYLILSVELVNCCCKANGGV